MWLVMTMLGHTDLEYKELNLNRYRNLSSIAVVYICFGLFKEKAVENAFQLHFLKISEGELHLLIQYIYIQYIIYTYNTYKVKYLLRT